MILSSQTSIAEYATMAVAALVMLAIILQKFLNTWKADKAESSVLTIMHVELERMSDQNTKLSKELGVLQEEVIKLNKELRLLTNENQRLHSEVVTLTGEVTRLQALLENKGV